MCHALITATFGGMTEWIALTLKQAGVEGVFFWYVTGCMALSFTVREPSRQSQLDAVDAAPEEPNLPRMQP
ncbi:hypothetical protein [Saccharopolyspora gloriosae]|uniref:hypothetical protein n=1 Tax=Saccharopolyspora gloriosae TaxID=455344 RepID=UPI001FB6583F|nr:hypothetical protein [Saccharopolyspora gloriosae]